MSSILTKFKTQGWLNNFLGFLSMSLIEASRKAGITYVVFPSKKKKLLKKGTKFQKMAHVYEKLSGPPKKIQRFCSSSTFSWLEGGIILSLRGVIL